ncbi:MAG: RagB/SusD family nutrient uptake outer membrane protein, partial [Rudanella sp.]|nr:RagB/SusD family nutrient uptake outer membrane protein [Rudanella sp.]
MTFKIQKPLTLLLLSGAMLLGPTSCKDFLEEMPPSNLTPDSFYTIPDHAESAIVSVYADMRGIYGGSGIFSSTWQMLEAPTGTSGTETAQNSDLNNLYSLVYDGNTGHIINLWNSLYRVIANANLVLEKVPAITPMNADQKARILAEARFLRAWAYFHAVRLWGDVPLVLTPQTTSTPEFNPGRIPQEQVYTQIVNDLVEAEKAPLAWMNSNGRVGMAAVKSQLAKVYLTMAGFPLSKGASHFTLAANKSLEVITYSTANPTVVGLFPTYMDVHDERLENRV